MRIISGKFGGRRFRPPAKNWPTRPTTDIAKEGLFNILMNRIDFASTRMLDLFGGTGNHCFEFVSRGCVDATYVDKHGPAVRYVKQMASELEIESNLTIIRQDVAKFLRSFDGEPYQYIFAGPPYPLPWLDKIPNLVFEAGVLDTGGMLVLEHNPNHDFRKDPKFQEVRNYGETHFAIFINQ